VQSQFAATRFELVSAVPAEPVAATEAAAQTTRLPDAPAKQRATSERADAGAAQPEALHAVFALSRPRRISSGGEIARFALQLTRDARGSWRVASFENRADARQVLDCRELEAELDARLARAHGGRARGEPNSEACNVLGLLVPGSCGHADPQLIERALAVRTRCHLPHAAEDRRAPAPPQDFQLSLRRGRPEHGLDRHPRYLLTLFATGQVIFHGRHWVSSQERSDGRTARALVADLYAHLLKLEWFSRRAGASCTQSELGDLITVRAGGRERTVIDREGCRDPFNEAELSELKRRLELIAGVQGWIAPRPGYADGKVEHWTLADSE
jgi:hypothetical protein